jgi:hypothetical protein
MGARSPAPRRGSSPGDMAGAAQAAGHVTARFAMAAVWHDCPYGNDAGSWSSSSATCGFGPKKNPSAAQKRPIRTSGRDRETRRENRSVYITCIIERRNAEPAFALERPALFRIMFEEPCDRDNDERVAATAVVTLYVRGIVERSFPQANAEALATAIWALVHGLAFLHLDGKLDAPTPAAVAERVTAAIQALLTASSIGERLAYVE